MLPTKLQKDLNNDMLNSPPSEIYITFEKSKDKIIGKGPIAKFFSDSAIDQLIKVCRITEKDSVFFVCNKQKEALKFSGIARQKIGGELKLIDQKSFHFGNSNRYLCYLKFQCLNLHHLLQI